jgi:hypothetical protein
MNRVGEAFDAVREGIHVGLNMAIHATILIGPAVVNVHVIVAGGQQSGIDDGLGGLIDLALIDIAVVGIPRVPTQGRQFALLLLGHFDHNEDTYGLTIGHHNSGASNCEAQGGQEPSILSHDGRCEGKSTAVPTIIYEPAVHERGSRYRRWSSEGFVASVVTCNRPNPPSSLSPYFSHALGCGAPWRRGAFHSRRRRANATLEGR